MDAGIRTLIVCILISAFGLCLAFVWKRYIRPFLDKNDLLSSVKVLVAAVEAEYGRHNGDEKLKAVLDRLSAEGFDIESQTVLDAIKAAWYNLNIDMIKSGIKDPEEEPEEING